MSKKRGRPPRPDPVVRFQVRVPKPLNDALNLAVARNRRPKNEEVLIAVERYLESLGLFKPPLTNGN